jgi:uncharacterized RDD family membrane protein YckC
MSEIGIQNPFAPPRALVEDRFEASASQVLATRMSRFLAVLCDTLPGIALAVLWLILAVLMTPGILSGGFNPAIGGFARLGLVIAAGVVGALGILVWNAVLVYRHGQTIGKRMMGIRVVRTDGSRVAFARYLFLRYLALVVICTVLGVIGTVVLHFKHLGSLLQLADYLLIFRASRLCLHDNIADTKVVTAASSHEATLDGNASASLRTFTL